MHRFLVTIGIIWVSLEGWSLAAIPVEGDIQALKFLRDLQEQNLVAFPRGRVRFRAHDVGQVINRDVLDREPRRVRQRQSWEGEVLWDRDRSYWDMTERADKLDASGEWTAAQVPQRKLEIRTTGVRFYHSPENLPPRAARIYEDFSRHPDEPAVLPRAVWWGPGAPWPPTTFAKQFNPELAPRSNDRLIVRRPTADEITVETRLVEYAGRQPPSQTVTCSLAAGGNVVRVVHPHWSGAPVGVSDYGTEQTFDWLPLADGRFRLKSLLFRRNPDGAAEPQREYALEILEFDPDPQIPANRFTFESFQIVPGTILVEERNGVRTETVFGKPPAGLKQAELDKLAEEAASRGFAKPPK